MVLNKKKLTDPSFSLQNRLARVVWNIFCFVFFRYSPRPLHAWRSFVLRIFGAKVGMGVHVYPKVKIWAPWNLVLGEECGVANGVELYAQGKITIGKRAVISQGTFLCTGTHDYTKKEFPLFTMPIEVKDDVWLAAEVFVHPGITIGEGVVVGARSVVIKDLPAWQICAGNPCKPIKKRELKD